MIIVAVAVGERVQMDVELVGARKVAEGTEEGQQKRRGTEEDRGGIKREESETHLRALVNHFPN